MPAQSGYDALRRQVPVYYSIRKGNVISHTTLSKTTVTLEKEVVVDFQK
ncbi:hypothetical protein QOZ84_03210 [Romboutsia sedimentorum]|uniref:Uncharacterized protein n=1 Tax=Romboutsia sedimentorum TaxID=1368474 RepID=A0ABT7E6I5_9FIRM|nr:hypothetical protein [Romboutsia sedimentorum]MDK2562545.1 hypothetical protein [Romboutsia sedimentorum]